MYCAQQNRPILLRFDRARPAFRLLCFFLTKTEHGSVPVQRKENMHVRCETFSGHSIKIMLVWVVTLYSRPTQPVGNGQCVACGTVMLPPEMCEISFNPFTANLKYNLKVILKTYELFINGDIYYIVESLCKNVLKIYILA